MKTSEILDRALNVYIPDESHWAQKAFDTDDERYCMIGAINMAAYGASMTRGWHNSSIEVVREALYERTGRGNLMFFNDDPHRTYAEVRAVMERARDIAISEENQIVVLDVIDEPAGELVDA